MALELFTASFSRDERKEWKGKGALFRNFPKGGLLIRYAGDNDACLKRLQDHPFLTENLGAAKRFTVLCTDSAITSFLQKLITYAPLSDAISGPLSVVAEIGTHSVHPSWLGVQKGNEIHLFYPAYRNLSTLAFTFFHEYAHWLHKQDYILSDSDWEAYLAARPNTSVLNEEDIGDLWEGFADDFAWYCTNPDFLRINNPEACRFLSARIQGNRC